MEVHIGKRIAEIELVSKDGNKVQLTIDGKPYEVDVVMAENGICSILHDGQSYNAELIKSEGGKNYRVNTHFSSYSIDIVDSQAKYLRTRKKEEDKQDDKIVSPMPGKILDVSIEVGQEINKGDTLVVLEAMKMQNVIIASQKGRVRRVCVVAGQTVSKDEILVEIGA